MTERLALAETQPGHFLTPILSNSFRLSWKGVMKTKQAFQFCKRLPWEKVSYAVHMQSLHFVFCLPYLVDGQTLQAALQIYHHLVFFKVFIIGWWWLCHVAESQMEGSNYALKQHKCWGKCFIKLHHGSYGLPLRAVINACQGGCILGSWHRWYKQ